MKIINISLLIACVLLTGCATKSSTTHSIVGVWELERWDNILPVDTPPWGMGNTTYQFFDNGTLRHFFPGEEDNITYGRGNTPFEEFIPYSIKGNQFKGWLGLQNDLDPTMEIKFETSDECIINYPDGCIATLKRISSDPFNYPKNEMTQIVFTVRGINYNKSFIEETRTILRQTPTPSPYSSDIIGSWLYIDNEEGLKMTLTFKNDETFERTMESIESSFMSPEIISGTYKLHNNLLLCSTFNAPSKLEIKGDILTYTMDGVQFVDMKRISE